MGHYIRRTVRAVFTIGVTVTLTFILIQKLPGGPMDFLMAEMMAGSLGGGGSGADSEQFAQIAELYLNVNPNDPLHVQYYEWLQALMTGDLGTSTLYQEPVSALFAEAIPWTVFLMSLSVVMSFLQQIIIGGVMANFEGSRLDIGLTTFLTWFQGIPFFVWGILLLVLFGYQLNMFPTGGMVDPSAPVGFNPDYIYGVIHHAFLPILVLSLASLGSGALSMRGNAIQTIGKDFVRVARLRGLSTRRISVLYIARNALLPMYTQFVLSIAYIFGGSLILETIFRYQGMGWLMYRGLRGRDYPLLMGGFLIFTVAVVIAVYLADMTYPLIDPRIKEGDSYETY